MTVAFQYCLISLDTNRPREADLSAIRDLIATDKIFACVCGGGETMMDGCLQILYRTVLSALYLS